MQFLKYAWRILVIIKDGLALAFLLAFFWLLYKLLLATPNPASVEEGALLLALDGMVVEQTETPSPADALTGRVPSAGQIRLRDIVRGLEAAAKDSRVKSVVLDLQRFDGAGQASLTRIGDALGTIRRAGKPIYAYSSGYFDDAYLLAAHANEIWLDPLGQAVLQGPGGARPYFKGLADQLGVNVHVYKVGTYKSAVEPYTRASASPEAKAANQELIDGLWADWKDQVGRARPKAQIAQAIAAPTVTGASLAERAKALGLIDQLGSRIAFGQHLAKIYGRDDESRADSFKATDFDAFLAAHAEETGGDAIGILTVAGEIVDGQAPSGMAGGDSISDLTLDALTEKSLKALVVRIDSPGGSVTGSEKIRAAIMEAKAQGLPVIVSMGDVAASGGYWIATAGDQIFAEPATVTGSIGVFSIFPSLEKTLARYGITSDGVRTTPLSGQPDPIAGPNPEVDAIFQNGVEDIYKRFTILVAQARKLDIKRVDEIGQGRVWLGGTARQLGLVDRFGSLDDAIVEAAKRAKLDPANVTRRYLEAKPSFWGSLLNDFVGKAEPSAPSDAYSRLAQRSATLSASGLYDALRILHGPAIQVRCIECPVMVARDQLGPLLTKAKEELVR